MREASFVRSHCGRLARRRQNAQRITSFPRRDLERGQRLGSLFSGMGGLAGGGSGAGS